MTAGTSSYLLYVGTYTKPSGRADGIYTLHLLAKTGEIHPLAVTTGLTNPSFLTIAQNGCHLYAVNEAKDGWLSAFSLHPETGALSLLNERPTHGAGPCYVGLDETGHWALVANYTSGTVTVFPVQGDGRLGEATAVVHHEGSGVNPRRQERAHAHSVIMDPTNRFALVADLGMDKVMIYRLHPTQGTLSPHDPPFISCRPGAGPRHMAFHPNQPYLYVMNELDSTVTVLAYDVQRGSARNVETVSTLPANCTGENTCAEIAVAPSGAFVYASNRGHDSITIFAVAADTGKLTPVGHVSTHGQTPRHFTLDPGGRILLAANQRSDTIVSYWVDATTGMLTPTGLVASVPSPVCLRLLPVGP